MENKILFETDENKIELDIGDNMFYVFEKKKEEEFYDFEVLDKFDTFSKADAFLKRRLDKKVKGILEKKPINAIGRAGYYNDGKYDKVKITSIDPTGYSVDCWISDGKNRNKRSYDSLLKDTEENWDRLNKIKELEEKISRLEKEKERFTQEELKEYFKND